MVAARRSSSAGASPQKQEKAPLKKKRGNSAKAGFVSLINSWARNEATDMSMSVSTACQLLAPRGPLRAPASISSFFRALSAPQTPVSLADNVHFYLVLGIEDARASGSPLATWLSRSLDALGLPMQWNQARTTGRVGRVAASFLCFTGLSDRPFRTARATTTTRGAAA